MPALRKARQNNSSHIYTLELHASTSKMHVRNKHFDSDLEHWPSPLLDSRPTCIVVLRVAVTEEVVSIQAIFALLPGERGRGAELILLKEIRVIVMVFYIFLKFTTWRR